MVQYGNTVRRFDVVSDHGSDREHTAVPCGAQRQLFGLRQESISIAGGIILFIIAIRMIFPVEGGLVGETPEGEPFLVPLAVPLVAGPSVLASILLLKQSSNLGTAGLLGAVSIAWAVSAAILISAPSNY